nr:metallophosphoesterase [Endozoicomonas sp. OPT23]
MIFIGDIHGQHQKLVDLLAHLNFDPDTSGSLADEYQLVFVGDLVDNAAQPSVDHLSTLKLVRSLVETGHAYCVMGNHELNAVAWNMTDENGQTLRKHSERNLNQHQVFLEQARPEYEYWLDWLKQLPLFIDFGEIRAIHACWQDRLISQLKPYLETDGRLKAQHWSDAFNEEHPLYNLVETSLKGPEIPLPEGYIFKDVSGHARKNIRAGWWLKEADTYLSTAQVPAAAINDIPDLTIPESQSMEAPEKPVIVGHYTKSGQPSCLSNKVVCVDYNAARGENPLVAYLWNKGETTLSDGGFRYIGNR